MCELQWLFGVLTLVLLLDQAVVRPFFILAPLPIVGQCMMGIMVAMSGDEAGCVTLHSIIAVQVGGSSAGRSEISSERRRDAKRTRTRRRKGNKRKGDARLGQARLGEAIGWQRAKLTK